MRFLSCDAPTGSHSTGSAIVAHHQAKMLFASPLHSIPGDVDRCTRQRSKLSRWNGKRPSEDVPPPGGELCSPCALAYGWKASFQVSMANSLTRYLLLVTYARTHAKPESFNSDLPRVLARSISSSRGRTWKTGNFEGTFDASALRLWSALVMK